MKKAPEYESGAFKFSIINIHAYFAIFSTYEGTENSQIDKLIFK